MSQLANTFPEILASRDIVQGKNPYPTLELSIRNPENRLLDPLVEKKLFALLADAGACGLSQSRLHSHHKINAGEFQAFADAHPERVQLVERKDAQGRLKRFLSLRSLPEVKPPDSPQPGTSIDPQAEIARAFTPTDERMLQDKHKLLALLVDGARMDTWLDTWLNPLLSWSRVEAIASQFPDQFEITKAPNGRELVIGLKAQPSAEVHTEPPPQKPPEPPHPELSPTHLAKSTELDVH